VVSQTVNGGQFVGDRSGSVFCPSGTQVTGGGFSAPYGGTQVVTDSRPFGNGWYVQFLSTGSITIYAICAK
jgi:hypothetical protein